MFATFAEHYQIWAAGARPQVEAAAGKGGARERGAVGVEERRKERGRKLEVKAKCLNCNRTQLYLYWLWAGKGINAKEVHSALDV